MCIVNRDISRGSLIAHKHCLVAGFSFPCVLGRIQIFILKKVHTSSSPHMNLWMSSISLDNAFLQPLGVFPTAVSCLQCYCPSVRLCCSVCLFTVRHLSWWQACTVQLCKFHLITVEIISCWKNSKSPMGIPKSYFPSEFRALSTSLRCIIPNQGSLPKKRRNLLVVHSAGCPWDNFCGCSLVSVSFQGEELVCIWRKG